MKSPNKSDGLSRDHGHSEVGKIIEGWIVVRRRACWVSRFARRNEDDHALPCASKQQSVCVPEINLIVGMFDVLPTVAPEVVKAPTRTRETQIAVPIHTCPVKFKALHLKLCGRVFEVIARPCVFLVVEKPMHWINIDANINCVRFQSLSLRRSDHSKTFRPSGVISYPLLGQI